MQIATELNTLDITIFVLIILMSIKGYFNGFFKELFGFIGLIGGIFIASRFSAQVAHFIDIRIFHLENFATLKLVGFLTILGLIWSITAFIGNIFVGVSKDTPHTILDKSAGLLTAGMKYFFIFSLIITALFRSPLIKENMNRSISKSLFFPIFDRVGSSIIYMSPKIDHDTQKKEPVKP